MWEAHAEEDETEGERDPGRELEVGGGQQEPANILHTIFPAAMHHKHSQFSVKMSITYITFTKIGC